MKHFFRILVILTLFLNGYAWAQNETPGELPSIEVPATPHIEMQAETAQPPPAPAEDYGTAFVKMLVALIVLFVIIALTIWLIKSFSRGRFSRGGNSRRIEIIEKRALSPKSVLYLLEVDGSRVLVSESQHEVRALYHGGIAEEKEEE